MALKSALLNVMEAAARKAARTLNRDFGEVENLQVSKKGPADFVSAADLKAEKTLRAELSKARPEYGFRLEEGGEVKGLDPHHYWVIDPLDGTTNFLHGIPHFAISIGVELVTPKGSEIIAGVILDPVKDELFFAEKGQGAYVNGRRLRVSNREHMQDSLFATGIPFKGRGGHGLFSSELAAIMPEVAGIRRFGAAALDLAYVAAGRYEGFWERGLSIWDIAPGVLMVREAGGVVTDFKGGDTMLKTGNLVAANTKLHEPLLRVLAKAEESLGQ